MPTDAKAMKKTKPSPALKPMKAPVVKSKRVLKSQAGTAPTKAGRVKKSTLRLALVNGLKAQGGRDDLKFVASAGVAAKASDSVPIEERGGYPVKRSAGSVDPKDWITAKGVKIMVDYARCPWLPDDWGQGIKLTNPTSHSTGGGGGILTTYVAPDGKSFFHKKTSEVHAGVKEFTRADGWNGQVRLAKLQAKQAFKLSREAAAGAGKGSSLIGMGSDADFFKILSAAEKKKLPEAKEFHFGVVSARRANKIEGVRDIFTVQCQFDEAGIRPTWYVDEASLKDYKALGLNAVIGGKLTASRNKALKDARSQGKVCVQVSDDISSWEYRDGPSATVRTDDAMNAAHAASKRYIISPVAAARFILAKMRAAQTPDGTRPRLGGVYMLGSCARTFCGDAFARKHFILGDFFVVDKDSKVNFDEEMMLKEDYDFSCAHIKAFGSVMRCNRMTLSVKHYANSGGAVTNRDAKGIEERRNIDLLNKKWPGCFRPNHKRKNEVIMKWKDDKKATASTAATLADEDDDDDDDVEPTEKRPAAMKAKAKTATRKAAMKSGVIKKIAKKPLAMAA